MVYFEICVNILTVFAAVVSGQSSLGPVRTTYYGKQLANGGCQMPTTDYVITDALALGQIQELGPLIWRSGLCGQVLDVDCGQGTIPVLVVDKCDVGNPTCGLDLTERTWNTLTANQEPGVTQCRVALSTKNPLPGNDMYCFHRPDSDIGNDYFVILGVLNTSGRIPASATINGVQGDRNLDGWFLFSGNGQPLFPGSAPVTFTFEDGDSQQFLISDCRYGGAGVQTFE